MMKQHTGLTQYEMRGLRCAVTAALCCERVPLQKAGLRSGCINSSWLHFQRRPSHLVLQLISMRLHRCRRHQVHPLLLQQALVPLRWSPCVNSCFNMSHLKKVVKNAHYAKNTIGQLQRAPQQSAIILKASINTCTRNVLVLLRSRQFKAVSKIRKCFLHLMM